MHRIKLGVAQEIQLKHGSPTPINTLHVNTVQRGYLSTYTLYPRFTRVTKKMVQREGNLTYEGSAS
jgi:hypothetical protein